MKAIMDNTNKTYEWDFDLFEKGLEIARNFLPLLCERKQLEDMVPKHRYNGTKSPILSLTCK